jgi:hypothetical protein
MVSPVSSADFDAIANEIGETITVYTPTQTSDSDYDRVATHSLGTGTTETAIVEQANYADYQASQGKIKLGDCQLFLKSSTTVTESSLVSFQSKLYEIISLDTLAPGGTVHHYEAWARFLRAL